MLAPSDNGPIADHEPHPEVQIGMRQGALDELPTAGIHDARGLGDVAVVGLGVIVRAFSTVLIVAQPQVEKRETANLTAAAGTDVGENKHSWGNYMSQLVRSKN